MFLVRDATEADREQVVLRIGEVFGDEAAAEAERLWEWRWHQDPRLERPGYLGQVAEWDGQIIANLATLPAGLHLNASPVAAHWCVDALVHSALARKALKAGRRSGAAMDLRGKGLAETLLDRALEEQGIQLAKNISDPMMAVLRRIGFSEQPESTSMHRRVSTRHTLARAIGSAPAALIAPLSDLGLARVRRPELEVQLHQGPFDDRFDALWHALVGGMPAVALRDRETLQWRYRAHPNAEQYRVFVASDAGAISGYLVAAFYRRRGRKRAKIVDLFAPPDVAEPRRSLLRAALAAMRRDAIERVEAFAGHRAAQQELAAEGFSPRLTKTERVRPLVTRGYDGDSIWVTQGDGDGG